MTRFAILNVTYRQYAKVTLAEHNDAVLVYYCGHIGNPCGQIIMHSQGYLACNMPLRAIDLRTLMLVSSESPNFKAPANLTGLAK